MPLGHWLNGAVLGAYGKLGGEKLLNRDPVVEICVSRQIGDTETTLTQDRFDLVPVQLVASRQGGVMLSAVGHTMTFMFPPVETISDTRGYGERQTPPTPTSRLTNRR